MGQCFLYGSGGGARSYKVTGSVSAPENPFHGDIWVQTSVAITQIDITSEQQVIPVWDGRDGMVQIVTGTQWSDDLYVDSDHRREYNLYLYPRACVQRFDGAWHRMTAYIYTFKNRWIQFSSAWDGTLFYNGNQYADVTGGWVGADSYSPNLTATLIFQSTLPVWGATAKMHRFFFCIFGEKGIICNILQIGGAVRREFAENGGVFSFKIRCEPT